MSTTLDMTTTNTDHLALEALADLERQLAEASGSLATGGSGELTFMSAKSGMLNIEGQPIPGNAVDAVIIDVWAVNAYYADAYDADDVKPPSCQAFNRNVMLMSPISEAPHPQAKACDGCPKNEWGSGVKGKGKACKNTRLVVFLMADGVDKGIGKLFALRVPVTSVKNLTQYSSVLATTGLNPMRVRTQISVKPDPKTQFKMNFALVEKLPSDVKSMQTIMDAFKAASLAVPKALTPQTEADEDESPVDTAPGKQSDKF